MGWCLHSTREAADKHAESAAVTMMPLYNGNNATPCIPVLPGSTAASFFNGAAQVLAVMCKQVLLHDLLHGMVDKIIYRELFTDSREPTTKAVQ
jgi:hypothetical protein